MELRRRVKLDKLENSWGFSDDAGKCSSNAMRGAAGSKVTQDGSSREVSQLQGSGSCSGLDIPPRWPWRCCVSMAAGLVLAVLLALAQAWCVNSIHENLLWFSQITVGNSLVTRMSSFYLPLIKKTNKQTNPSGCVYSMYLYLLYLLRVQW